MTDAHRPVVEALGVQARVLPMSDEPVATWVGAGGEPPRAFQEYMILAGAPAPVDAVELRGLERARPTGDVLTALAEADAIVIGPSNPVISIGPILALPGMREALAGAPAPVVAVSPFVGGRVLKGPTAAFCAFAGIEPSAAGVARAYEDVLDGIVSDEPVPGTPSLEVDTLLDTPERRRAVATNTLEFAASLDQ